MKPSTRRGELRTGRYLVRQPDAEMSSAELWTFYKEIASAGDIDPLTKQEFLRTDLFQLNQQEDALVWQTHPRTKGSTGYLEKIRDTDYVRSDHWLGAAFKALPVDLSRKRLGEVRCFGTLDDLNNWGRPKYMVGEPDTHKEFPEYDLYGDFNVNYLKLDDLPTFGDWRALLRALRKGEFFVTTGEVLIPYRSLEGHGNIFRVLTGPNGVVPDRCGQGARDCIPNSCRRRPW